MNRKYIFWAIVAIALIAVAYFAMRPRPTESANVSRETEGGTDEVSGKTQRIVSGIGTGLTGLASAIAGAA
jgi:hypothetical protein